MTSASGCALRCLDDLGQRVRRQLVVMIEQRDEFAARELQGEVRGDRDAAVHGGIAHADALVGREFAQRLDRRRRGRGIVAQAQLPVRIRLPPDRFDARAQPLRIGVVDRDDDADERLMRQRRDLSRERREASFRPSAVRPDPSACTLSRLLFGGGGAGAPRTAPLAEAARPRARGERRLDPDCRTSPDGRRHSKRRIGESVQQ